MLLISRETGWRRTCSFTRVAAAKRFEELIAWQLCTELDGLVCSMTESGNCLDDPEFCDQIRRASQNAAPLIAEGFIRFTPDEFVRYLRMARGELAEVQSRLRHARTREFFTEDQWNAMATLARRAMGTTTNLLKSKLPLINPRRPKRRNRRPNR
jgi:four helix bundle protein